MDGISTNGLSHLIPPALNVPSEEVIKDIVDSKIHYDPSRLSETHAANTIFRTMVQPAAKEHSDLRELAVRQLNADEEHRLESLAKVSVEIATTNSELEPMEGNLEKLRAELHTQASTAGLDIGDGETPADINAGIRKTLGFDQVERQPNAFMRFLGRLMENIGVPLIVLVSGAILAVTLGTETGFFSFADMEEGLDFSVRTLILFFMGPAIVWVTGEFLAHTVRINHGRGDNRGWAIFLCVMAGMVWLSEIMIEAFGFRDLYLQHAATLLRVGMKVADRPFVLFLVFGFIASSPYFAYKIAKQWVALMDQEKAEGKAVKRLDEENMIRKFLLGCPAAQKALDLSGEIQDRLAEYNQLRSRLQSLEAKKAQLLELSILSLDIRRRLEAAEKQAKDGMRRFCELTGTSLMCEEESPKKETKPFFGKAKVSKN